MNVKISNFIINSNKNLNAHFRVGYKSLHTESQIAIDREFAVCLRNANGYFFFKFSAMQELTQGNVSLGAEVVGK